MNLHNAAPHQVDRLKHRPASLRRLQRMQSLIVQLRLHNMSTDDIAASMACSHTAARNYVGDLLSVHVICAVRRAARVGASGNRIEYRLTSDEQCLELFLASVATADDIVAVAVPSALSRRHVHLMERGSAIGGMAKPFVPRRDALVAALFGPVP